MNVFFEPTELQNGIFSGKKLKQKPY